MTQLSEIYDTVIDMKIMLNRDGVTLSVDLSDYSTRN